MDNSLVKSNLKKLEFPSATPSRHNLHTTEFQSVQKARYEASTKQSNTYFSHNSNQFISASDYYHNQKEIYENTLPIKIRGHDRDEFQSLITFKMSVIHPNQSHNQILHLELTDPSNHLFLYVMDVNETEFFSLKTEQSLLVDFQAFPPKLVEILERCLPSSNPKDEKTSFDCVLEIRQTGEAALNVVENNLFKALCHLSLRFREATDHILKQHLAYRLTTERSHNEDLRTKNERLEDALSKKSHDYAQAVVELKRFQEERDRKIEEILVQKQREVTDLAKESFDKEKALNTNYEHELRSLKESHDKTVRALNDKLEATAENLRIQTEKRVNLESTERELSNKVRGYEREISLMESELQELRAQNKQLDSMRFANEKLIAELTVKCEGLEAKVKGKEELVAKQGELVENSAAQRAAMDETIADYKKRVEKLEQKCAACSDEINKGNEIIEKLQSDIATQKQKLKTKNSLVLQQEQTINEHLDQIEKLNKQLSEFHREHESKDLKFKDQEMLINDLRMKIQESQKTIEANQSMIQYLNKCLNDNPRGAVRVPFTSNKFTSFSHNGLAQDETASKYSYAGAYDRAPRNSSLGGNEFGMTNNSSVAWTLTKSGTGFGVTGGQTDKSPLRRDFDRDLMVSASHNKENIDYSNTGRSVLEPQNTKFGGYKNLNHQNEFTSVSSMDMSTYNGTIQPIKYKDPSTR